MSRKISGWQECFHKIPCNDAMQSKWCVLFGIVYLKVDVSSMDLFQIQGGNCVLLCFVCVSFHPFTLSPPLKRNVSVQRWSLGRRRSSTFEAHRVVERLLCSCGTGIVRCQQ